MTTVFFGDANQVMATLEISESIGCEGLPFLEGKGNDAELFHAISCHGGGANLCLLRDSLK